VGGLQTKARETEAIGDMAHALQPVADAPLDLVPAVTEDDVKPTMDHVWASLPVLVPMLVSLASRMVAIDLAYHVRAGNEILAGSIPRVDSYSFTVEGSPWLDQQWGAQALMAIAHGAGGFAMLAVLRAAMIGGAFGLIYLACRARGAVPRSSSLLSLAGFVACLQTLALRPQLFAVVLFAATLWILAGRLDHPRRMWMIPGLALVWSQVHGTFFLAGLLVALSLVEDRVERRGGYRRTWSILVLSIAATAVNPFGLGAWSYVRDLGTNPVIRRTITEWAPTSASTFSGAVFFLSGAVIAGWLARRRGPAPWGSLVWLGTFFVLALPAQRGIVWWAMIAPVAVAGLLPARAPALRTKGSALVNVAIIGALAVITVAAMPLWRDIPNGGLLSEAPVGVSAHARTLLPDGARIFVPQPWASWFEFDVPGAGVFVDPRIELFGAEVWRDYNEVRAVGADWSTILDRWRVDAVVVDLDPEGQPLADALDREAGWCRTYSDAQAALFVRLGGNGICPPAPTAS
jgi:hypothetical protein